MGWFNKKQKQPDGQKISPLSLAQPRLITTSSVPASGTTLYESPRSYSELYRTSHAVRSVVDFLARRIATYEPQTANPEGQRTRPDRLTATFGNSHEVLRYLVSSVCLTGNAFLPLITNAEGEVIGVQPANGRWGIKRKGTGPPIAYELRNGMGVVELKPEDVLHLRLWNPDDVWLGVSPLDSLRHLLAEDEAASEDRRRFFGNSARPFGWLEDEEWARQLGDEGIESMMLDVEDAWSGDRGTHRIGHFPGGLRYHEGKVVSAADTQLVEARSQTIRLVAAAYGVAPQLVGASDTNFPAAWRLVEDATSPYVELLESAITEQVLPRVVGEETLRRSRLSARLVQPVPLTDKDGGSTLGSLVRDGVITADDARAVYGLPTHADGDVLHAPTGNASNGSQPNDRAVVR